MAAGGSACRPDHSHHEPPAIISTPARAPATIGRRIKRPDEPAGRQVLLPLHAAMASAGRAQARTGRAIFLTPAAAVLQGKGQPIADLVAHAPRDADTARVAKVLRRAAIFTASLQRSLSATITSPRLIPMRNSRRSSPENQRCADHRVLPLDGAANRLTAGKSTNSPSPVVLIICRGAGLLGRHLAGRSAAGRACLLRRTHRANSRRCRPPGSRRAGVRSAALAQSAIAKDPALKT